MSYDSYSTQTPRLPTTPELIAQIHVLDTQIQQTDREIARRYSPEHPRQQWWVNNCWRPFVAQWDRGMGEVWSYEASQRSLGHQPLIELLTGITRMGAQYRRLLQSAGANFYIDVSSPHVSGIFDDIGDAFKGAANAVKGAAQSAISFVRKPPGWFATIFPLMTMENQRYWSGKIAGSTGEKLYDAGVKAVASKYLGPQGPALIEAYNKVTDDAASGNLNAKEILAKAPEIAKLAIASNKGPGAFRAAVAETKSAVKVSGDEGELEMYADPYVGSYGQSYPEVAARAVQSAHAQNRSPLYGYLRSGVNQKIYLFSRLEDARAWFDQYVQLQPDHDYVAVFSAANLRSPIAGMEHFTQANVSGAHVGNWGAFLLGLPLGGLGGYFLRRWQEQNPGLALPFVPAGKLLAPKIPPQPALDAAAPKMAGDYYGGYTIGCPPVGGPWLDLIGQDYGYEDDYGGDMGEYDDDVDVSGYSVGAQDDSTRRRAWPQTKALIESAIAEVQQLAVNYPAEAYVWKLDAPSIAPYAGSAGGTTVMLTGTTNVVPFSSQREALDYLREQAQTRPVALALFERSSRHWPNPTAWRKSDQPEHDQVIAQHLANQAPTQTLGAYVGADTGVDTAVNEVRRRAQQLAERRVGNVIGVIHTSKDNLWHVIAFRSVDDADDWLNTTTQNQNAYTYAAYFDKEGESWPLPYIEKIGGFRQTKSPQRLRGSKTVGEWMP